MSDFLFLNYSENYLENFVTLIEMVSPRTVKSQERTLQVFSGWVLFKEVVTPELLSCLCLVRSQWKTDGQSHGIRKDFIDIGTPCKSRRSTEWHRNLMLVAKRYQHDDGERGFWKSPWEHPFMESSRQPEATAEGSQRGKVSPHFSHLYLS